MSLERRFLTFVAASSVFMFLILRLDGDGIVRQLSLGFATAGFLWFFARRSRVDSRHILCAVIVASIGEVVLSLGWGLYSYQHALIPLYVPPGHGLFYALAADTALQEPLQKRGPMITRLVLIVGSVYAIASLIVASDVWGFLWWLGALALIRTSRNRLMLSSCFVYTIFLELAGTAIGNWRWAADVPFVQLQSGNPPAGVGILYILLDLIVMAIMSRRPVAERSEQFVGNISFP